ncbi:YkvA family protein [Pontibacter pamirensis]|uniref:YkvA family protein n=1 Tax=Pontibacter pamirensis TaxID=2562824 RepID=UPI00138968DC|nr:YkvA family protein [Pontibacter pamirensis]
MTQLDTLKQKTHAVNTEIYALYLAYRDSRVEWYVRMLLALAIGYAISPVDLVPDLTPVFGYLDDVVIVAAGFRVSYQLLTKEVRQYAQFRAYEDMNSDTPTSAFALKIVSYAWLLLFSLLLVFCYKLLHMHTL